MPAMPRRGERMPDRRRPDPGCAAAPLRRAGLPAAGEFRAPRSALHAERVSLVLPAACARVQRAWDYYKGMGAARDRSRTCGTTAAGSGRPGRSAGSAASSRFETEYLRDPLGVLRDTPAARKARRERAPKPTSRRPNCAPRWTFWAWRGRWTCARCAAATRNWPSASTPTSTAATASAEERLKDVNRAYSLLRQRLGAAAAAAAAAGGAARPDGASPGPAGSRGDSPAPGSRRRSLP